MSGELSLSQSDCIFSVLCLVVPFELLKKTEQLECTCNNIQNNKCHNNSIKCHQYG